MKKLPKHLLSLIIFVNNVYEFPMFKKMLDARRTLAYGLEFRKFKRKLNVIKRFCFCFIFMMLRAKSVVITQLEVITVTIPLAGSKISNKY
jgi:hypothetical protein